MECVKYIVSLNSSDPSHYLLLYKRNGKAALYKKIDKEQFLHQKHIIFINGDWAFSIHLWETLVDGIGPKLIPIYNRALKWIN